MSDQAQNSAEHYTSYHSEDTYSLFDETWGRIKRKGRFDFEYNGKSYSCSYNSSKKKWMLFFEYLMPEYLTPDWGGEGRNKITEFTDDATDVFITTFEIEGKTVEWILNHQREWKYKLSAEHIERVLHGYSFEFVYRKIPCMVYYYGGHRSGSDPEGWYIYIRMDMQFDPTHYAPERRGEKRWSRAFYEQGLVNYDIPPDIPNVKYITFGPFKTVGELLDTVRLNDKTLRVLFDTEYDDRNVLCGDFDY